MPWLVVISGYLLGSIPTAFIAGHLLNGIDIRMLGDKNAGAANAFRELGPKTGIAVGLIDAGKGMLAVLVAQAADMPQLVIVCAGVAAVIGHNWPVFVGFRGGRGVSTTIGVLLVLITKPMLIVAGPAVLVLVVKRNVSLACAFLFVPISLVCWWLGISGLLIASSLFLPILSGFTHFVRTRRAIVSQS